MGTSKALSVSWALTVEAAAVCTKDAASGELLEGKLHALNTSAAANRRAKTLVFIRLLIMTFGGF